jgi:putative membrane protein
VSATKGSKAGLLASGWPRRAVVCSIGFVSSILSAILLVAVEGRLNVLDALVLGAVGLWLPALAFSLFQALLLGNEVMNFKRGLDNFSALLSLAISAYILGYMVHLVGVKSSVKDLVLIGTSLAASLNALVNRYITGRSIAITGTASILWPLLTLIATSTVSGIEIVVLDYVKLLLVFLVMLLPAIAISKSVDNLGEMLVGVKSKEVFRAYATNWFMGAREELESFFNGLGVDSTVSCNLLFLLSPTREVKGVVVVPQVHPGPLRNVGSSSLPSDIVQVLESSLGANAIAFHGFVTHASDITSSKDYRNLLERVRRAALERPGPVIQGPSSRLVRVEVSGLSIGCQLIKGIPMVFVSGDRKGINDVPESVRMSVERAVKEAHGVKPLLINAHNSYEEDPDVDPEELERGILGAVDAAFESSSHDPIKIGVGASRSADLSEVQGVGPSGVRVLIIEFRGSKSCYVVVDANNANREFRDVVRSAVKSMGYEDCELFTTDNHAVVHLRGVRSSRGYYVLGEKMGIELFLRALKLAIDEAERNLSEVDVVAEDVTVKARVLGDSAYKSVETLVYKAVRKFRDLGLAGYGLALISSLLLCGFM